MEIYRSPDKHISGGLWEKERNPIHQLTASSRHAGTMPESIILNYIIM